VIVIYSLKPLFFDRIVRSARLSLPDGSFSDVEHYSATLSHFVDVLCCQGEPMLGMVVVGDRSGD